MNIYEEIADRIITEMENGIIPWRKPWTGVRSGAISHVTGKAYSILNQMLLGKPGEYITFNQCKAEGGKVKKGAKAKFVTFWKIMHKDKTDSTGKPVMKDGKPVQEAIPMLRYYNVFHIDDCEGISPRWEDKLPAEHAEPETEAERVLMDYVAREHIQFNRVKSNRAFYSPTTDSITVPLIEQFTDTAECYSTYFHESVHSTGHKSRLDRFPANILEAAFGSESYSKEELTAEIGSAIILHELGMETPSSFVNSVAYIQNWLKALRNDKRMIVAAASRAEKAARMILDIETTTPGEGE